MDAKNSKTGVVTTAGGRELARPNFYQLNDMPPELEWFANIANVNILAVLFFHGLRREELCKLCVKDVEQRQGVAHLRVHGKGGRTRFVPAHPAALARISDYLNACGYGGDMAGALFRPVKNPRGRRKLTGALTSGKVDECVVRYYFRRLGISPAGFGPHVARATAATHALNQGANIAKVQEWLGHANIATTRIYARRGSRPEDSPTFRMSY